MEYAIYTLAVSAILTALILANINRRASWAEGVKFSRRMAADEAAHCRVLYNQAIDCGQKSAAQVLNAQADIMRSFEIRLKWEMVSRFMEGPECGSDTSDQDL